MGTGCGAYQRTYIQEGHMLRFKVANPLNVHALRRVDYLPPHFTPFYFDLRVNEKNITDWIWANLSGRFYFGDHVQLQQGTDSARPKTMCKIVAFEIGSEASYFGLSIDIINQSVNDIW